MKNIGRFLVALIFVMVLGDCAGVGTPGDNVAGSAGQAVKFVHDDTHAVGCWFLTGGSAGSISCLPDSQYHYTK